jgi:hypothetical protein
MKPEVGRRVFVGSMVAGLPLVAATPGLVAQSRGTAPHDHSAGSADPVIDHLVRQIAAIHNAAQGAPRGEHYRGLSVQLRTLAVYDRQINADDQLRRALRQLVDREGRNTVLYAEPDVEMRRRNLQSFGFRPPARARVSPLAPTHAERDAALEVLLQRGVTPLFDRMAATADRIASLIDASPARTVADDSDWWRGFCAELWNQYQQAQLMASPVCFAARWFQYALPSCAAMEGGAMVLILAYLYECELFASGQ